MSEELENLNKQFEKSLEDLNPIFEDAELLGVLKEYVDARFDLLQREVTMLRGHVFEDESDSND